MDLAADGLAVRRRELPERAERLACEERRRELDAALIALDAARAELERQDEDLAGEVAALGERAADLQGRMYDGSVTAAKELGALQQELGLLAAQKADVEARELELLERIEAMDAERAANRSEHEASGQRLAALDRDIAAAEAEIDAELDALGGRRADPLASLPEPVRNVYTHLRGQAKLKGRAAAPLRDGTCQGCRVGLPVLEVHRIRSEPAALFTCPRCGRVLVPVA